MKQKREEEEVKERKKWGEGKGAKGVMEGGMKMKARSLRIMCQISPGKVSSPPNGTTGSFSMKSLICWSSPRRNGEGSGGGGGRGGRKGQGGAERAG